ncbi:fimbria/pilus outer membrane usher protein [Providencia alcalifaciens]|uniref:fimbria/pilus outer membrane usher protein n=1 Tax=Providencia TaxID=586 RepID=UPI0018E8266B|nr:MULTISPECIES: fimbria/pilus outer membrane usher protein [Providencia]EJD6083047.1 fimbria/pilus outer membrane usher protein [Providencia rettgeri]EJD6584665.1 fimbria/pilus outer membrane usher protein [Providencia rettgeri]EJD6601519.1 fimbria/pilus outer membrane usher protein [Providencia rettgeri]ELR5227392.1 fimbria/pilus outer membrane usher protein [Providencia rettgeri]ELR5239854.1 fimbria/pilus outer membrane usher protein [Providencia rettgeri]
MNIQTNVLLPFSCGEISLIPTRLPCQRFSSLGMALAVAFFLPHAGWANDELNWSFLQGGDTAQSADFLDPNAQYYPGRYFVDVSINGFGKGKRLLTVTPEEKHQLCFTPAWLASVEVYLRPGFFIQTFRTGSEENSGCYALGEQANTEVSFDAASQTLTLTIPQAGLTKEDTSLDWGFGNNALRLNYNLNANKYRDGVNYYGSTSLLANIDEWVARGSASLSQDDSSVAMFTVSKALLELQSDIVIGKTSVSSGDLGGLSTYGMTLSSNNTMRRQMSGYTPVFSGVATSTARVTLRQGNTTLYSELVPPGPFEINDVTVLTGGDVVMTVTENDGSQTQQIFPITLINGQLSPGEHEYSVSFGVTDNNNAKGTPSGGIAAFNYGYGFGDLSLRTGALVANKFTGVTGSITTPLWGIGSVSAGLSGTQSRYSGGNRQGQKSTLTYAKTFDMGTSIRLTTNQMSQSYDTLGEYNDLEYDRLSERQRLKRDLNIGISQPLWQGSSFSVGGWERWYWNQDGSQRGLNSSFSTRLSAVNLSVSASYYKTARDDQYSISTSVSIPFSVFGNNVNTFASMSTGKNTGNSYSAGASTNLTDRWSVSASESWGSDSSMSRQTNLWSAYSGSLAQLNGQMSRTDYGTTGSGSLSGSMMYLPANNSVIFGKNISDTVAVVNVKDASGVSLMGRLDETDRNGNLIVPMNSYRTNTLTLDASTLPANTELSITSQKIKPTGTSVTYVPFESVTIKRYLLQVRRVDGELMSPGLWATSESGVPLGFVGAHGVLLINSVDALGTIVFPDCQVPEEALSESAVLQEVTCEAL